MDPVTLIILLLVGGSVVAFFTWSKFRQGVRIRANDAVDGMSTDIEKMEDDYGQLMAKLPVQQEAVQTVMALSSQAEADLDAAEAEAERLKQEYLDAKASKAPESVLDSYAGKWEEATDDVTAKRKIAEGLDIEEEEAISALESTTKALKQFESRIEQDRAKVALTEAINIATEARQQADATKSSISRSGQASRRIDLELRKARAGAKISRGTRQDQELADWEEKKKTRTARAALDALIEKDDAGDSSESEG